MTGSDAGAGPATHHAFFSGLHGAGVSFLAGGSIALVLHGVPRLTPVIELTIDARPENVAALEGLLASWDYLAEAGGPAGVRRFRNARAALDQVDVTLAAPAHFAALRARAARAALVDVEIPFLGAGDLRALRAQAGTDDGREDAAGLDVLAAVRAGCGGDAADTRREQIRKFSGWSTPARLDWLLSTARLAKGLAPEAKPMTRGLVRRRGWYGR